MRAKTSATSDVILDFTVGDDIDLATIDANDALAGTRFSFLAAKGAAFIGAAGQLRWFTQGTGSSAVTIVEGTINADKVADFQFNCRPPKRSLPPTPFFKKTTEASPAK